MIPTDSNTLIGAIATAVVAAVVRFFEKRKMKKEKQSEGKKDE